MEEPEGLGTETFLKRAPSFALGIAGFFLLLSFFTGWYGVEVQVDEWAYDSSQPDNKGAPTPFQYVLNLDMKMFSMDASANPDLLEQRIEAAGEPSYDEHAGRIGTKMLGMFLLQGTALVAFGCVTLFFWLNKRKDHEATLRRIGIVFLVLGAFTLLYFATTIGAAAQQDVDVILADPDYRFAEGASYDTGDLEVGFWKTWRTDEPQVVQVNGQNRVWEVTAMSRPGAGWWLHLASMVVFVGGAVLKDRAEAESVRAERTQPRPVGDESAAE